MLVAILFARLGPYHHARLGAAAEHLDVAAVEYSQVDLTYAWRTIAAQVQFTQITLFQNSAYQNQSIRSQQVAIESCLTELQPDVVVIPGWSSAITLMALAWCRHNSIPTVLMSASTEHDDIRKFWKEFLKRRLLKNISTALVGGQPHRDYLIKLSFPKDHIFLGYNVVGNAYFSQGADQARQISAQLRQELNLPQQFFLASARFVEKKNIHRLLKAYAQYRTRVDTQAWPLILLGDGPLKPQISHQIEQLNLTDWVQLPGFKQYDELPSYYGLASCFVHASIIEQWGLVVNEAMASGLPVLISDRCGCATDLVQEGANGYTFDPYNTNQLAELMIKVSSETIDLTAMGKVSQKIIDQWAPQTFANNLKKAAKLAFASPQKKTSLFDKALFFILIRKYR